jgi:hypothetical protein
LDLLDYQGRLAALLAERLRHANESDTARQQAGNA